jgi:hypothetical protein
MQNPSWCFVVKTTYFIPAFFAAAAHFSGLKFTGLNESLRFSYSFL